MLWILLLLALPIQDVEVYRNELSIYVKHWKLYIFFVAKLYMIY